MNNRIDIKDKVVIGLINGKNTDTLEVLYTASCPGDLWVLKAKNGDIYYIQAFAYMVKINE